MLRFNFMKESIGQNMKNIGVGIAATVASVGIPKDAVAQQGLLGRIKDKIKDKIELVGHRKESTGMQQVKTSKEMLDEAMKKEYKPILCSWEGDKIGFKYPFDKEYKSDENYYRTVAYSTSFNYSIARTNAQMIAENKIFTDEMGLTGYFEAERGPLNLIDIKTFQDDKGIFTTAVAIEVAKKDIKVKVSKPEVGKKEKSKENLVDISESKKKDSIFYNGPDDKIGFKYPFNKEYKSDENYYRVVVHAEMSGEGSTSEELFQDAKESAEMDAVFKILGQEMKLNGRRTRFYQENYSEPVVVVDDKRIHLGYIKIIDEALFENKKTGVCTAVIAVEIKKDGIKIEKAEPVIETQKSSKENLPKDSKEYKVEKPIPPPLGNKPEKQPEYVKPTQEDTANFIEERQKQFDVYKKSQQSSFDALKEAQQVEFDKLKNSRENK